MAVYTLKTMSHASDLNELGDQAYTAYQQGRPTFIARFKAGAWAGVKVGEIPDWEDDVDAVESVGWVMSHWSVAVDPGGLVGAFNAFAVFRRCEGSQHPQDSRSELL